MQHTPEPWFIATEATTEWSVPIFVPSGPLNETMVAPWRARLGRRAEAERRRGGWHLERCWPAPSSDEAAALHSYPSYLILPLSLMPHPPSYLTPHPSPLLSSSPFCCCPVGGRTPEGKNAGSV